MGNKPGLGGLRDGRFMSIGFQQGTERNILTNGFR